MHSTGAAFRALVFVALLFTGCCQTVVGPPGDDGSIGWQPTENTSERGSGGVIDCGGNTIEQLVVSDSYVTIVNCNIDGSVRIQGPARNANSTVLLEPSREDGYVAWLRDLSPTGVTIESSRINANGSIPLYVGPGVTMTRVENVTIAGPSTSTMVYLDAESYGTVFDNVDVDASEATREAIAIDASDHNIIRNTTITSVTGGIYMYRNCGEAGVVRHTTPSNNVIERSTFAGAGVAVWLGSREGNRCYCQEDAGYEYGSSISDMDHARYNTVRDNDVAGSVIYQGEYSHSNIIENN